MCRAPANDVTQNKLRDMSVLEHSCTQLMRIKTTTDVHVYAVEIAPYGAARHELRDAQCRKATRMISLCNVIHITCASADMHPH